MKIVFIECLKNIFIKKANCIERILIKPFPFPKPKSFQSTEVIGGYFIFVGVAFRHKSYYIGNDATSLFSPHCQMPILFFNS